MSNRCAFPIFETYTKIEFNRFSPMASAAIGPAMIQSATFHNYISRYGDFRIDRKRMVLQTNRGEYPLYPIAFYSQIEELWEWLDTPEAEAFLAPLKKVSYIGQQSIIINNRAAAAEIIGGMVCGMQPEPYTVWHMPGEKDDVVGDFICLVPLPVEDVEALYPLNGMAVAKLMELLAVEPVDLNLLTVLKSLLDWAGVPYSVEKDVVHAEFKRVGKGSVDVNYYFGDSPKGKKLLESRRVRESAPSIPVQSPVYEPDMVPASKLLN